MAGVGSGPGTANVFECRDVGLALLHRGERRSIVEGIAFEVRRGEFFTIVGVSGTGKTTLLRILGGLVTATSGTGAFDRPAGRRPPPPTGGRSPPFFPPP